MNGTLSIRQLKKMPGDTSCLLKINPAGRKLENKLGKLTSRFQKLGDCGNNIGQNYLTQTTFSTKAAKALLEQHGKNPGGLESSVSIISEIEKAVGGKSDQPHRKG